MVLMHHTAQRMFAPGATRGLRATAFVILAALRRVSGAIGSESSSAEKHGGGNQRNQ
jgi:hypothetical protein